MHTPSKSLTLCGMSLCSPRWLTEYSNTPDMLWGLKSNNTEMDKAMIWMVTWRIAKQIKLSNKIHLTLLPLTFTSADFPNFFSAVTLCMFSCDASSRALTCIIFHYHHLHVFHRRILLIQMYQYQYTDICIRASCLLLERFRELLVNLLYFLSLKVD